MTSTKLSPEKAALHRAAEVLGGQAAVATVLGYSDRRAVWPWFNTDRQLPAEHCPDIEAATRAKGAPVLCEELRPDVSWGVLRTKQRNRPKADAPAACGSCDDTDFSQSIDPTGK